MSAPQQHHHHAAAEPLSVDKMIGDLKTNGLRITRNRRAILETLLATDTPLKLEEIQTKAGESGHPPDYATVFRVINKLEELKMVHRVNLGRSCTYFELTDPAKHYDHLVCTDCGRVSLIQEPCPVEKIERKIQKNYGYTNLTHSLEFFGQCPDCTSGKDVAPAR